MEDQEPKQEDTGIVIKIVITAAVIALFYIGYSLSKISTDIQALSDTIQQWDITISN